MIGTFALGVAVGFLAAKMPAEFWSQLREETALGFRSALAWLKSKFKGQ